MLCAFTSWYPAVCNANICFCGGVYCFQVDGFRLLLLQHLTSGLAALGLLFQVAVLGRCLSGWGSEIGFASLVCICVFQQGDGAKSRKEERSGEKKLQS